MQDYKELLKQGQEISDLIATFLDEEENLEGNLNNILKYIQKEEDQGNNEIISFSLKILSAMSINHHRSPNFFQKIEKIIFSLKTKIKQTLSNLDLFTIFEKSPRIIYFLFDQGMLSLVGDVYKFVYTKRINKKIKFRHFLYPVIKNLIGQSKLKRINKEMEIKFKIDDFNLFKQKCLKGENDSYICSLIRNDSVEDFIKYTYQSNTPIHATIEPSFFETNEFLIDKRLTLIQYAAFFGSIKIFNYLLINNAELSNDLLLYAIHGRNAEIIHTLETSNNISITSNCNQYLYESIKCYHFEITDYIIDNYVNDDIYTQHSKEKFTIANFLNICIYNKEYTPIFFI